jgi:hypothetical protein
MLAGADMGPLIGALNPNFIFFFPDDMNDGLDAPMDGMIIRHKAVAGNGAGLPQAMGAGLTTPRIGCSVRAHAPSWTRHHHDRRDFETPDRDSGAGRSDN